MEQRDTTRHTNGKNANVQYGDGKNEVTPVRRASLFFCEVSLCYSVFIYLSTE